MQMAIHEFDDREDACEAVTLHIIQALSAAIQAHGCASLVASGGSSPAPVYRAFGQSDLAWDKVRILPSDERMVAHDDCLSNFGMLRRELNGGRAASAELLSLVTEDGQSLDESARHRLEQLFSRGFDFTLLGMGSDGHIASLFPDAADLDQALTGNHICYSLHPAHREEARVSLSANWLLKSKQIGLLIFGDDKRAVFDAALNGDDLHELPVRLLTVKAENPVTVFWAP